jgi:O-acetylhomoserine (thiol)-lyase
MGFFMDRFEHFATLLPSLVGNYEGPMSPPIVSSAAFGFGDAQTAEDIFSGAVQKPLYSRMGNPTTAKLEGVLAQIDGGVGAVAVSSGMAAINLAVMGMVSAGDEIIAIGGLFGGTYALFTETLNRFGVKTHFFDVDDHEKIEQAINEKTKVVFCEAVGNPNMRLPDLGHFGDLCARYKLCYIVDNTVTPIAVMPFEYGADMVVYSTTKLLSGSAHALGGAVVFRGIKDEDKFHDDKFSFLAPFIKKVGKMALIPNAKKRVLRDMGFSANAFNSYMTLVGLETLAIRSKRIFENVEAVADGLFKEGFDVTHPSRSHHEHHKLYKKNFSYGCGPLLTVDMGNKADAFALLDAMKRVFITVNIGDTRTLGVHTASTIYRDLDEASRRYLGITDGLIRFSIGLESPADILEDFYQARATIK